MMGKYMYDCYDKDEKPLGIFFEDGTKELLEHHPDVKYVRDMDAVTRLPVWHEVKDETEHLTHCQAKTVWMKQG